MDYKHSYPYKQLDGSDDGQNVEDNDGSLVVAGALSAMLMIVLV